ncbi:MFS transporter, partial [Acinetobacter baumannii]
TLMGMTMFTLVYLTPMFLSQVRGYSPLDIGRIMMVQGFSMFFTAPIIGRLQTQMDRRLLIAIGALLVGAGCWLNGH